MPNVRFQVGDNLPLTLQLEDGDTGMYPQCELYNPSGTLITTRDLSHVANGLYVDDGYAMPSLDYVVGVYIVYTDSGHTTESPDHMRATDLFVASTVAEEMSAAGYTAARAGYLDELAAANMPADLDAVLADTDAIDSRLPTDPADESLQQAAHAQTQADIAALNNLSQADVQSALTAQGYTTVRAALLDNLDAAISSVVADIAALSDLSQADVQAAMTSQGYSVARAALIDNLDATVSSRSSHSAADVRDAILSDSTPFDGADIAAILADTDAIDTRLPSDPADESLQQAAHAATQAAIAALNDLSQADVQSAMTAQGYTSVRAALLDFLDAAISSRSSHSAADVDTELSASHGGGSWEGTSAQDWTSAEREQIRGALGVVGSQASPAGGGDLQDVLADTDAIDSRLPADPADQSDLAALHAATVAAINALNDLSSADVQAALTAQGYTAVRAALLDFLDAAVSSRSSHSQTDVDILLSIEHGSGSWEGAGGAAAIASAVWDEDITTHTDPDSAGEAQNRLDDILTDTAAIDGRLPSDPADESLQQAAHSTTQAAVAAVIAAVAALNDLSSADITAVLDAQGLTSIRAALLDYLDTAVSSRSSHTPTDVDTELSAAHGSGDWQGSLQQVVQSWVDKTSAPAGLYGAVRVELERQFTPMPGATLALSVLLNGSVVHSVSGLSPNAQGYWDVYIDHIDVLPEEGTLLIVVATVTNGPDTYVGATGLSVPEVV